MSPRQRWAVLAHSGKVKTGAGAAAAEGAQQHTISVPPRSRHLGRGRWTARLLNPPFWWKEPSSSRASLEVSLARSALIPSGSQQCVWISSERLARRSKP